MHIAHFIQRYPPALGGSEAYFERLTNYLILQGNTVDVWTTTAIDLEAFWKAGRQETAADFSSTIRRYQPIRFPLRRYLLKALSFFPSSAWQAAMMPCNPVCPKMWQDAGRFSGPLDAVHASAYPYAFPILCAWRLARRRKVPLLITPFLHLGDPTNPHDKTKKQYTQPQLRWLLQQADTVFVQTNAEATAAAECGVQERKIVVQGLGVDAEECTGGQRVQARKSWGIHDDNTVAIGHLANKSVEKGTVDLLKAVIQMAKVQSHKPTPFHIVLAGPTMENFQQFWTSFPVELRSQVTLLGRLTEAEKKDFFEGIDLFCLPSRSDSFGLVLLEAWANGKPNIVYRAGGPAEIIRHGQDGLISDCNPNALAESLKSLIDDHNARVNFGAAGKLRTTTEFNWQDKLQIVQKSILKNVENKFSK